MGKAKVRPSQKNQSTHSYNLRNREAVKAKKEPAAAPSTPQAVKNEGRGKRKNASLPRGDSSAKRSVQEPPKERKILNAKRTTKKAPSQPLPVAQPCTSQASLADQRKRVYAIQERIPLTTLEDLKGMDDIQEDVKAQVIWPFSNVEKAHILKLDVPRGVLLTGMPGTGKTALADAIVNDIEANGREVAYYHESGGCLSKWVGETEANLRHLFQTAKENAPSVIFLDELDGLGKKRSGEPGNAGSHTILTTLLTQLNQLPHGEVLLIAATNCQQLCDPALIRKGRFDVTVNIPLPSSLGREQILSFFFDKKNFTMGDEDMSEIVEATENLTGCDLKSLVSSIHSSSVSRKWPGGKWLSMSEEELLEEMQTLDLDMEADIRPKLRDIGKPKKANKKAICNDASEE